MVECTRTASTTDVSLEETVEWLMLSALLALTVIPNAVLNG